MELSPENIFYFEWFLNIEGLSHPRRRDPHTSILIKGKLFRIVFKQNVQEEALQMSNSCESYTHRSVLKLSESEFNYVVVFYLYALIAKTWQLCKDRTGTKVGSYRSSPNSTEKPMLIKKGFRTTRAREFMFKIVENKEKKRKCCFGNIRMWLKNSLTTVIKYKLPSNYHKQLYCIRL